jgi:hypothetical protein
MSSNNNSQTQEIQGWKLEINHDGVILNWYPSPSEPKSISKDIPSDPKPKPKSNLFDYFYIVSDGVIFTGQNGM